MKLQFVTLLKEKVFSSQVENEKAKSRKNLVDGSINKMV